jgi:hypothetical protein
MISCFIMSSDAQSAHDQPRRKWCNSTPSNVRRTLRAMDEPKNAVGTQPDPGATSKRRCRLRPVEAVALGIVALVVALLIVVAWL